MRSMRDQRGVAMVTVILVGAAMTAVTSVAALSTIRELRAGSDDRKATGALAYAEAGVDRSLQHMKGLNYGILNQAGCEKPALTIPGGQVDNGEFTAYLKVFNPSGTTPTTRYSDGTTSTAGSPTTNAACLARPTHPEEPAFFVINSTGTHPSAKRVVEQVIKVVPQGFPIGLYAKSFAANGTPNIVGASMVAETTITGREKLIFAGCDPYYTLENFWPSTVFPAGMACGTQAPSAAHAVTGIKLKQNGTDPEFTGTPASPTTYKNCTANGTSGLGAFQALWDGDGTSGSGAFAGGCGAWVGTPLTSKFTDADRLRVAPKPQFTPEDYQALKELAKASGIYCSIGGSTSCTKGGASYGYQTTWQDGDIASLFASGTNNFIAYFDFTTGSATTNDIKWKASAWPCNPSDPSLTKNAIIIVRNGGVALENGAQINGAMILDGDFKYNGNVVFNGTIISKNTVNAGGGVTFSLDECWVDNMSISFFSMEPLHWSEIDR